MSAAAKSQASTQIVTAKSKALALSDMLEKQKDQLARALPRHLDADRLVRVVMTSVQRTPGLLACTPASLIGAVIQAAQLGLEPDGALGHAYLVPFKETVQFIPGYRGYIDLALRSGKVSKISGRVVYAKDAFDYDYGTNEHIAHRPSHDPDRGEMTAAYAVAKLSNGDCQIDVMPRHEVEKIRDRSAAFSAKGEGPWITDEAEMWKKTAVRRLAKYLPMSIELAKIIDLDERAERGVSQNLEEIVEGATAKKEKPTLDSIVDANFQEPA